VSDPILSIPPIEHLVFSTREASPEGGTGFNREVVASSLGMPDGARRELARLADMTGPVLARPELPPLWAFRRLDTESWLLARAVSLGLYRKGHHQLLVHGAVLPRELVDRLDGNPFLLATPEARAAGFRFIEEHPGGRSVLSPLTVSDDGGLAAFAWRSNVERLSHLSARFPTLDSVFADLYERAVATLLSSRGGDGRESLALVAPDSIAAGQAEVAGWIEWLLLHLHPADRAEVAFHTAYAYEQATPFAWIGAAAEDLPGLRRQLRGLATWSDGETPTPRPADDSTLGDRIRQVRGRAPDLLPRTLETYYLTRVPGSHGTDLRKNPFHPLDPDDADLCMRAALDLPLTEKEETRRTVLAYRGDQGLSLHVGELAEAWREGPEAFEAHLGRLAAAAEELRRLAPVEPGDVGRLPVVTRPEERFVLLALLSRLLPSGPPGSEEPRLAEHRARLGRAVVPASELAAMLALLDTPERRALGERELVPWSDDWLDSAGRGDDPGSTTTPAWETWVRWLHRSGRPVAPAAGRIERAILQGPPDGTAEESGERRLTALRRLERACSEVGLDPFALRLLFQREIPRLSPAAARVRWADGVAWLFRDGEDTTAAAPFLAPALADPELAPVVLDAVADRVLAPPERDRTDPHGRWSRARRLLQAQPRETLPAAAAGAAGAFLARLAADAADADTAPERLAEMLDALGDLGPADGPVGDTGPFRDAVLAAAAGRLGATLSGPGDEPRRSRAVRGLAALLDARLVQRPLGEPEPAVDRALLDAALPALVLRGPRDEAGGPLRVAVSRHLGRLLDGERLPDALRVEGAPGGTAGPWRHLLLDEIAAAPPANPEDDPRYRAVLDLSWRRWAFESGRPGASPVPPAAVALARVLPFPGASDPGEGWHRRALARAVDSARRADAEHLLTALLRVQ
jgi:hypothetical protein